MSGRAQRLAAELTWTGERFERGVVVEVGGDGRIARVERQDGRDQPPALLPETPPGTARPRLSAEPRFTDPDPTGGGVAGVSDPLDSAAGTGHPPLRRLPGSALLPGFVDAHSHAFQRGLRGRGESFPEGQGSFWSWREAMYGLVESLDADRLHDLSLAAFGEMRAAGITAVGEFHYLHHDDPAVLDFAFDEVVLTAAAAAGIRIVLLSAYYAVGGIGGIGGIGRPLAGAQRRFATPSPEIYWRQHERLAGRLADPETQGLGVVAHSVRAAGLDEIAGLWAEAKRRRLPFHMHLEEQRQEIAEAEAAWGRRPMALLLDRVEPGPGFTAVHCTHTEPADLVRYAAAGGRVCVCPLTEANLGDGIPPLAAALALETEHGHGGSGSEARQRESGAGAEGEERSALLASLCLGTDSNARISMLEEMRWLEYGQRLAGERRGALRDPQGRVAPILLAAATRQGAAALGLPAGDIAAGRWADLAAVDLGHPDLAGATDPDDLSDTLAEALVFGAGNSVIAATCVGGRWDREP